MRLRADIKKDPPIIHCERKGFLGEITVSPNQFTVDELMEKSWMLKDQKYYDSMVICIQSQCKRPGTVTKELRKDLTDKMASGIVTIYQIQQCVKWIIQNTPAEWQLAVFSYFFYPRQWFFDITHKMPYFRNVMDKQVGFVSWTNIPFFKCAVDCYETLRLWVGCPPKDYPTKIGPFYGELHLISYIDSSYTFSNNFHISAVSPNLPVSNVPSNHCNL